MIDVYKPQPKLVAKALNITPQYASMLLSGKRKGKKYRAALNELLGAGKKQLTERNTNRK